MHNLVRRYLEHLRNVEKPVDDCQTPDEFLTPWPPLDLEMVRESLEAYHRGEYRTVEELLHESLGCGVPQPQPRS